MTDRAPELGQWLAERLSGETARQEWRNNLEAAWNHVLDQPLSVVFPVEESEAFFRAHWADEAQLTGLATAVLRAIVIPSLDDIKADDQKVGRWVPEEAKRDLLALVSERGVVDPAWVESIFREPAVEAIVTDTLYRALIDFSTIVPRLIQSISPLGRFAGGIGGITNRIVEEIEKRLEPEIRRFLDKGTRKALDGASRFAVDHMEDAASLAFRRNMLTFAWEQSGTFHARAVTPERLAKIESITRAIASEIAKRDETKTRIHAAIQRIADRDGKKPIRAVLLEAGIVEPAPFDAWARATFPMVATVMQAPVIQQWLGQVAVELLGHVGAS